MEKATFKFDSYQFTKASFDLNIPKDADLAISFNTSGIYSKSKSQYQLNFDTYIQCEENGAKVINISCVANFSFVQHIDVEDIPEYFYPNCLAIVFPYIRAFISTISLQANVNPIILPTINLMGITEDLRSNTIATE